MFYPGQEVECIDASDHPEYNMMIAENLDHNLDGLEKGKKYTVRWCGPKLCYTKQGIFEHPHVRLHEIHRANDRDKTEAAYLAFRFRPLRKQKTDISVFKSLLRPTKPKVLIVKKEKVNVEDNAYN